MATIITKNEGTSDALYEPTAGTQGELLVNTKSGKLWVGNDAGGVTPIATDDGGGGGIPEPDPDTGKIYARENEGGAPAWQAAAAESHQHVKADITDFAHTHTKAEITDFDHTHDASALPANVVYGFGTPVATSIEIRDTAPTTTVAGRIYFVTT